LSEEHRTPDEEKPEPEDPKQEGTGTEGTQEGGTAGKAWAEDVAESYRSLTSWLTDEIENLDKLTRKKIEAALQEVQERFPPEKRRRIVSSVEEDFRQFGQEIRKLVDRLRENPRVADAQERGREALKSSLHHVKGWAEKAEERLERPPETGAAKEPAAEAPPGPAGEEPATTAEPEDKPREDDPSRD